MTRIGRQTRLTARIARSVRRMTAEAPAEDRARPESLDASAFARELAPGHLASERARVTELLFGRLTEEDVTSTEQLLRDTPGAWGHYEALPPGPGRHQLLLALGTWLEAPNVRERTGLVKLEPPEDVHSMTRGVLAAAGGLYEADLIADALAGAGIEMSELRSGLDFGCSSGRVLRVLHAAYPDVRWHGCDPNAPAVTWAEQHLPAIHWFVSKNAPPLPLDAGSLDLVYAISIWSHFAPELGLRWLEEMRRVIRPGGCLVFTTHGPTSVAHYAGGGMRSPNQSGEIAAALYTKGHWYAAEFGEQGDWGVVDPEWGTSFLSPEWLLAQLCPRWRVLEFAPGRNQDNQDVYVLQRV